MEPEQLGYSTADGNIVPLRSLHTWTAEIEEDNQHRLTDEVYENLQAVQALDFTNAYGLFFRSVATDEVFEHFKRMCGMLKSEWQNGHSYY